MVSLLGIVVKYSISCLFHIFNLSSKVLSRHFLSKETREPELKVSLCRSFQSLGLPLTSTAVSVLRTCAVYWFDKSPRANGSSGLENTTQCYIFFLSLCGVRGLWTAFKCYGFTFLIHPFSREVAENYNPICTYVSPIAMYDWLVEKTYCLFVQLFYLLIQLFYINCTMQRFIFI